MVDFIERFPVLSAILIVVFIIGIIMVPAYFGSYNMCSSKAAVLDTEFRFGFYEGCFIKENGKWIDYDRYRFVNQE